MSETKTQQIPEMLRSLSPEELAKVKPLTKEEIEKAFAQGRADRDALMEIMRGRWGFA